MVADWLEQVGRVADWLKQIGDGNRLVGANWSDSSRLVRAITL